jgi:hypothetical protein
MRSVLTAVAIMTIATMTAHAEIMCTERGGCWETGKHIRLIHSRQETSVPSRDGKGQTRIIGIANDMPHQNFSRQKGR